VNFKTSYLHPMDTERAVRVSKAAEKFWLLAIAISGVAAAHAIITEGWDEGKKTLIISGLATLWYGFRRSFRKRMENHA